MALYVFLGGPRDGETVQSAREPISSWSTMQGRYVVDKPPQTMQTPAGAALILRFEARVR